ncbi:NCS2 family permease [Alginatibacterium sediminis]|uniref:NCS2 family permease n=1 Tax=Alginatibacterium sediminis TaxID=2164068 RepID=A0A420E8U2_9ALTE|nr:NCS2 family permease [Alginatibacterium sediminis]RKF15758.1 NCS2 family permease [Alginatibacterium sediminis]
MLETIFKLKEHGTNVRTEIVAGLTTFLTMAYIIFVNPSMLSATGMDSGAVFVATCLAAAVGCFIMGFYANYPIAQAPGMGLNAFFTYGVVLGMGHTWQVALGAVFLSGTIFLALSVFKVREWIINSIPATLRTGIAAGIGLFLGLIALKNAGIVVSNPATMVGLGDIHAPEFILACLGFVLIIALEYRKIKGGVLISILAITVISILLGLTEYSGIFSAPPSIMPTIMQLDIAGAFDVAMISVIFAFLFVDLFDTAGTLTAVAQRGKLLNEKGELPNLKKALLADSTATIAGSMMGTSSTTSYIESGAGVEAGGRTGLTAVVVGILFLFALFFSPLAGMVPAYATAGALFYVCVLMLSGLANIDWTDLTDAAPAAIIAIITPLSFSIADGIAFGFMSYALIKLLSGRYKSVPASVWVLSVLFALKFAFF